jgi:hypothetical protein
MWKVIVITLCMSVIAQAETPTESTEVNPQAVAPSTEATPPSQPKPDPFSPTGFTSTEPTVNPPLPQEPIAVLPAGMASTEKMMTVDTSSRVFSQLLSLQVSTFNPRSVTVSNGDYDFKYGPNVSGTMVEAGWSVRLFPLVFGSIHFEEGLAYASLSGSANSSIRGTQQQDSLQMNMLALDSRVMYSMDWFPWKRLIPFADGGYQLEFYNQTGASDLESVQGNSGNFVAGAGLRFWLNRGDFSAGDYVSRVEGIPFFLLLKYSHVFPNQSDLDLASDSYSIGLQMGI